MGTFTGTSGDDQLVGTSSGDFISGLGGNDYLVGLDGADNIQGGAGDDTIVDNDGRNPDTYADTLSGGDGNDTIYAGLSDNADGGTGHDSLILRLDNAPGGFNIDFSGLWTGATYTIDGGTIKNFETVFWVTGSQFDDFMTLGTPAGETGQLSGLGGNDTLTGGPGNDKLNADDYTGAPLIETAHDIMQGGAGDDVLAGGIGDYFDGGTGSDAVIFDVGAYSSGVNLNFFTLVSTGSDTILGAQFLNIEHVAGVYGTQFDDTINVGTDTYGTSLEGRDGNDTLVGGFGNDHIDGGTGADTMEGGSGNDTYFIDNAGDVTTEAAGGGLDTVYTTVTTTLQANVENLILFSTTAINGTGNELNNSLSGNDADNTLNGADGDDTILGSGGDDLLRGADGNDTLYGNNGNDTLQGGANNDLLNGGAGQDTYTGGSGSDKFQFDDNDFAGLTSTTADLITDFKHGQSDHIDLSPVDAIVGGTDNAFTFIGAAAFTGVAGQLDYAISGGVTMVYGDTNGDGVADFAIALTGSISLVAADFVL